MLYILLHAQFLGNLSLEGKKSAAMKKNSMIASEVPIPNSQHLICAGSEAFFKGSAVS